VTIEQNLPEGRLKRLELWISKHRFRLLAGAFVILACVATFASYKAVQAGNNATDASEDAERAGNEAKVLAAKVNHQQKEFEQESLGRRRQSCRGDEQEHKDNVRALRQTYKILSNPKLRAQFDPGLIQFAIANLPAAERKARVDQAPEFCDEPGVKQERLYKKTHGERGKPPIGLPEPDPVVPKKKDFSYLLAPSN
jgi:hypothetical protein